MDYFAVISCVGFTLFVTLSCQFQTVMRRIDRIPIGALLETSVSDFERNSVDEK